MKGLEPPRLAAPDPKSGSATNYDTSALCRKVIKIEHIDNAYFNYLMLICEKYVLWIIYLL